MAWTTPGTAVAGEVLEAAFWNEQVRDNSQYLKDEADDVGLVHITTESFTSASAVNVNNCFSATYNFYRVMLLLSGASSNGSILRTRLRASGSDSSTSYYFSGIRTYNSSATISSWRGDNVTYFEHGYTYAGRTILTLELYNPFEATNTPFTSVSTGDDNATGITTNQIAGMHLSAVSYDGFSVFPSAGNITGVVRVYGYRNG